MPSFPGKPDFSSAGAEDGLAVVLPLALLPALPTLTGYFIHTFFFFFNFYFANLQPGLQNFPRRDCASAAGAVPMRGARNARVPPPRGRDRRSGAGKRGGHRDRDRRSRGGGGGTRLGLCCPVRVRVSKGHRGLSCPKLCLPIGALLFHTAPGTGNLCAHLCVCRN